MNKNKIERLKETIKSKRGKEVGSGYFRHVEEEPSVLEVDVCDVLDALSYYEIDEEEYTTRDEDGEITYDIDGYLYYECEEIRVDNTYNWGSPISNHINFEIFKTDDMDYIVRVMVHMNCSDIRCGYSDYMYFKFNYEEQFLETITDDTRKYIPIEITKDGEVLEYDVIVDIFYDGVQVLDEDVDFLTWDEAQEILELAWEQNAFDGYLF